MADDFAPSFFKFLPDGKVTVLKFHSARLTEEDNLEQLGYELTTAADKCSCKRVILDVATVVYVSSSVIGKWISLHRKLDRDGGKLAICGLQSPLQEILDTARLLTYFHVASDVPGAKLLVAD